MADTAPPLGMDLTADQGGRIVASNVVLIILPTIFVIARFVSRYLARAGFWWDDLMVVVSLLLGYIPCICVLVSQAHNGFGKHIWVLGPDNTVVFLKILYVYVIFYHLAVCAIKACLLFFYRRIFPVKQLQLVLWIFFGAVAGFAIATTLATLFQCSPIDRYWYRTKDGSCLNTDHFLIGSGIVNTILDFCIIMLPIPLLWRLKTTASQKGVLTGIFICAGFVCIISIIRLVVLSRLTSVDLTWNYVDSAIWSAAEPSMGVICACLPSLRPLVSILLRGTVRGLGVSKYGLGSSNGGKALSNGSESQSGRWGSRSGAAGGGNGGEGREFDEFFNMDAPSDPGSRKVGHRVDVRGGQGGVGAGRGDGGVGGGAGEEDEISLEAVNPPEGVIRVKDEVTVTSSDWLEYKDKVY